MKWHIRSLALFITLSILVACSSATSKSQLAKKDCTLTEPTWIKPPTDSAVLNEPAFGYYFVNEDQSIWASAWQAKDEEHPFLAGDEGNKMGWFRPAGADLVITGKRLDAKAPPLEADVPVSYPTRFQATGVYFPTAGCWQIDATAENKELSFSVWVEP